jgi:hypothetical protein
MNLRYIGEDIVFNNQIPQISKELKNGEIYDVEIKTDAPNVIVNGVPVIDINSTTWICFPDGVSIPYSPELVHNFWEG